VWDFLISLLKRSNVVIQNFIISFAVTLSLCAQQSYQWHTDKKYIVFCFVSFLLWCCIITICVIPAKACLLFPKIFSGFSKCVVAYNFAILNFKLVWPYNTAKRADFVEYAYNVGLNGEATKTDDFSMLPFWDYTICLLVENMFIVTYLVTVGMAYATVSILYKILEIFLWKWFKTFCKNFFPPDRFDPDPYGEADYKATSSLPFVQFFYNTTPTKRQLDYVKEARKAEKIVNSKKKFWTRFTINRSEYKCSVPLNDILHAKTLNTQQRLFETLKLKYSFKIYLILGILVLYINCFFIPISYIFLSRGLPGTIILSIVGFWTIIRYLLILIWDRDYSIEVYSYIDDAIIMIMGGFICSDVWLIFELIFFS
jgi:hypothetical protein